ncbi:unnamed protein product [Meloidogyne enterolobii]|uniref:Uncharacterized protein n=1 Tax=Meloidogyne enterolobii TaxID=390850 RepID=A0ACB0XK94_MELEN
MGPAACSKAEDLSRKIAHSGSQQQQQYRSGMRSRDGRVNGRFPPPRETRHRMRVTNLSTRFSWQV